MKICVIFEFKNNCCLYTNRKITGETKSKCNSEKKKLEEEINI